MPRIVSNGRCSFCDRSLSKTGMTRHLPSCPKRPDEMAPGASRRKRPTQVFQLLVSTRYPSEYWLQLEATADVTLDHLDGLLRDVWLECCGHLSSFQLGQRRFSPTVQSAVWDEDEHTTIALGQLVSPGQELQYQYDFGSTTELTIRVVGERQGQPPEPVVILARNDPPERPCSYCDAPATSVCTVCPWESDSYCDACVSGHECDEDRLLPVLNSPRTGVCGYDGTP